MPTPAIPQTPKRPRKLPEPVLSPSKRLHGIVHTLPHGWDDVGKVQRTMKARLRLDFMPEIWQAHVVQHILQGYDTMVLAATGMGKSLIFEGAAALAPKGKVVVIICPLKALEQDQVSAAAEKGLRAIALNEDTERTAETWEEIRSRTQLLYMSPEMARAPSFREKLLKDPRFRTRVATFAIDECHCIDIWGDPEFRPDYRLLGEMRQLFGLDTPFCAVTATCRTSTFKMVWKTLYFGHRPFWGLDIGADRHNLFFHVRPLLNPQKPILDALNLIPKKLDDDTMPEDIPKCIFYFDSHAACRDAKDTLRRVLPQHLRNCVYAFTSMSTEKSKRRCWEGLRAGTIRIVCATDAAGMGCSIPDIKYTAVFWPPKSLSILLQRWGRAARARGSFGVCLLFVPLWAFRPELRPPPVSGPQPKKKKEEPKRDVEARAGLDPLLEGFINVAASPEKKCWHAYVREHYRPDTDLDRCDSLTNTMVVSRGTRSRASAFELTWTVLDLAQSPSRLSCCGNCNPNRATTYVSATEHDDRLFAFEKDFAFPIITRPQSPQPVGTAFVPFPSDYKADKDDVVRLERALERWRIETNDGDLDPAILLPPKQMKTLLEAAARLLRFTHLTSDAVLSVVRLDTASRDEVRGIASCIDTWRRTVPRPPPPPTPSVANATPQSKPPPAKRARKENTAPPSQPIFEPPPTPANRAMLPPPSTARPRRSLGAFTAPTVSSSAKAVLPAVKATPRPKPQPKFKSTLPTPTSQPRSSIPFAIPTTPLPAPSFNAPFPCPSPTPAATSSSYYRAHTYYDASPVVGTPSARYYRKPR